MTKLLQICVKGNVGSTGTIAESIGVMAIEKGWESHMKIMNLLKKLLI